MYMTIPPSSYFKRGRGGSTSTPIFPFQKGRGVQPPPPSSHCKGGGVKIPPLSIYIYMYMMTPPSSHFKRGRGGSISTSLLRFQGG